MTFFGRRGGPVRLVLSVVAVGVLGLLLFVVTNLNQRLDNQQRANESTIAASEGIVAVNDRLTQRLGQLTELTHTAQAALDETSALAPLLTKLRVAIEPAAAMVATGTRGAETSNTQLVTMHAVLDQIRGRVLPLVESAAAFGDQGKELLTIVRGLVADLKASVAAARTINATLPLPG
jgi:hypothetical protein